MTTTSSAPTPTASLPQATPQQAGGERTQPQYRQLLTPTEAARRLHKLSLDTDADETRVVAEVVEIAAGLTGALGVVFLARNEEQRLAIQPSHYFPHHLSHLRSLLQHVLRLATVACAEETPQAGSAENGDEVIVVTVPVFGGINGTEALAAAIGADSQGQARTTAAYLIQVLTWIAAYLGPLRKQSIHVGNRVQNANLRLLASMLTQASKQPDLKESGKVIAEWVRDETCCSVTVIGTQRGLRKRSQLIAHSDGFKIDARCEAATALCEVVEETIIADVATGGHPDDAILDTSTAERVQQTTGLTLTSRYPLRNARGETFGAILCLDEDKTSDSLELLPEFTQSVGQHVALLQAAEPHPIVRKLGLHHSKKWYRHPYLWSTMAGLFLLLLLPVHLKVKCPCVVQPYHRRYVAVPYEGRLEQALTEPGQIVERGELLARMDGRDVQWEISGLTAQLRQAEKDEDTAMAAFDTSASQVASFEVQRLQLQIDELHERLRNLEIRSPVDGIVIGGDPRKLEGSRMSMGETLLEVAQLDKMIVELEVPDEDISHIEKSQLARYRLDALPWKSLQGDVQIIHPRAEVRNGANVFVAELELDNHDHLIRPGMHGRAKIVAARHSLGWNLFHKAYHNLLAWIGW